MAANVDPSVFPIAPQAGHRVQPSVYHPEGKHQASREALREKGEELPTVKPGNKQQVGTARRQTAGPIPGWKTAGRY